MNRRNPNCYPAVLVCGAIAVITAMVACCAERVWSDEIIMDGRTETAQCHTEYTEPPTEVCVSESWICSLRGGELECETNR